MKNSETTTTPTIFERVFNGLIIVVLRPVCKIYPNDYDLGRIIRKAVHETYNPSNNKFSIVEFESKFSNNYDLGNAVRKYVNSPLI
jgi:hypothetical protein